ncbi:MAG: riboflavin biosynthesis protein RibF [Parabacteroides sp.]
MRVIRDTQAITEQGVMATIGFFDGVHLGHRFLIDEVKAAAAARGLPSAVITFPAHPRAVLQKDYQPRLLNSFEDKLRLLATTGVDYCIVLDFTVALSQLSAEAFLHILATEWRVKGLVIGYDHRFGHDRRDGFTQYVEYGTQCGIEVLKAAAFDAGHTEVSSSEIRRLLHEGAVEQAAHLLTYAYSISGRIVSGYKVGRTLGFPTANIQPDDPMQLLPGIGVYAVWVEVAGKRHKGMLYIGSRPTLDNGAQLSIEVHILQFSGDIYNDPIRVTFERFVRGDEKFDSLEALKAQLMCDREVVDQLLN